MTPAQQAIATAVGDGKTLLRSLTKKTSRQVSSEAERNLLNATSLMWFNTYRPIVSNQVGNDPLREIDSVYQSILEMTTVSSQRASYASSLKSIEKQLGTLAANHAVLLATSNVVAEPADLPPSFARLATDPRMQVILTRRWQECIKNMSADAPLSAVIMMGGLLEALLIARVNQHSDKAQLFKLKCIPVDKDTGKPLQLQKWMLQIFIDVAHEMSWISRSAKDVGEHLRDYRNYIHPYKELSEDNDITLNDAKMNWVIAKAIARELLT